MVHQSLHIIESHQLRNTSELRDRVSYVWYVFFVRYYCRGEWTIISDIGTIYVINNTDRHQLLVLSPIQRGFIFYPTNKNVLNENHIIVYPRKCLVC